MAGYVYYQKQNFNLISVFIQKILVIQIFLRIIRNPDWRANSKFNNNLTTKEN